ncbi:hypothetical protein CCMSSC00406_0004986 [Pleurotus cornucopiae]|uniref:Uncharacterized protein n=1 Tax=Pleurotus cornucopiae TaxID=5321 RepID=A0ACB7IZG9_PLECO|nr:hypothetical protein CCMSSC00406_0004986 [Pleurotus cornucopiae]
MLYLVHDFLLTPKLMVGWVNGNLYKPTSEVSGVLPIPDSLQVKAGMGMYIHTEHSRQLHHFLASRQGTRQPVLPINNDTEWTLFRELMARSLGLNFNGPDWDDIVVVWNSKAEIVKEISYKLPEQLKAYYNGDWKKFANIKQTKAMTATERHLVKTAIHSPQRFNAAPLAPSTERQLHSVTTGFAIPDDSTLTPSASLHCSNTDTGDQPLPQDPPLPTISPELITAHLSVAKAQQSVPIPPAEKMRKAQTCRKCALDSCGMPWA